MKNFKILNNYSIRSKLIIIYLFCVLIPMIVTNSIVYITIKSNEVREQRITMEHAIERVKYNLSSVLDDCVLVSNHLHNDITLNDFITRRYDNLLDYYERYNYLLQNNVINYYYNSQHVYQVTIYTDNDTISNSSNFRKLTSETRQSEWYRQFYNNNEDMTISVYYDDNRKNYGINNTARTISITRKLDNFDKTHENILKIDVDYNVILNDILNEKMEDNLYVCNKSYILFSNKKSNVGTEEFDTIDSIEEKDVKLNDFFRFKVANEAWNIIITANEVSPLSKIVERKEILFGLAIFNLLLPTIIIILVSHSIGYRVTLLGIYLGKVENEEFSTIEYNDGQDEIGKLIRSYNLMVLRIKELIEVVFKRDAEKQRLELAKKQAELKALQSQVNPHFMFNTLESIRMRSLIKGESETAEIIENLSALLRKTINWGEDYITIEDEMLFVENYLQIQKYRFGEKLTFSFYVMGDCKGIRIPKLSILSFVENACVHGIEEVSHNASINVSIFKYDSRLFIEISDTGSGMEEDQLNLIRDKLRNAEIDMLNNSKSTGVLNTYMRLQMYCNNNMQFEIDSKPKEGTDVTIQIFLDEPGVSNSFVKENQNNNF
ncbi:sensor histidine kinase [Clostridium beijerinckii]|uniref:Sensor histidine kinase YpdA n=1 Tax=Clostridium beijerinckii TaxID=1520 RepID=A0A1S8SDZ7_CLOBE|nr:histidine kinase [Clostridium beijerinckii]NRY60465.1 two-component system sensor histidine kinase YesM [Clostridium beijerinckii]OOM63534.1 sensor histidine kinase YpdA [Clostridium beijerinckii]